jgi:hypothetical protein
MQDSYVYAVLPECSRCMSAVRNDSYLEKFGLVHRMKCPEKGVRDTKECREFSSGTGRSGRKE